MIYRLLEQVEVAAAEPVVNQVAVLFPVLVQRLQLDQAAAAAVAEMQPAETAQEV
jgi:hypothetical protein